MSLIWRKVRQAPRRIVGDDEFRIAGLFATGIGCCSSTKKASREEVGYERWERVVLGCIGPPLEIRIQRAVRASPLTVERERKGRAVIDNFRSDIHTPTVEGGDTLVAQLATRFPGSRPMELLKAEKPATTLIGAMRAHQLIDCDGIGIQLLPSGAFHSVSQFATLRVAQ